MQPHPDLLPGPSLTKAPAATIRAGRDADAAGFIALIEACWSEYPGCIMDLDNEVPELRALATYVAGRGGALWAAEEPGTGAIVGMVATYPLNADNAWEVGRMYVARAHRGSGLARALLAGAEAHARDAGAQRIVLWTDTRFEPAHRFYEKHSYVRSGSIRVLDDVSRSLEFRYTKPIRGLAVEVLDAAAAASAERVLAAILVACVDAGASVSFMPPLSRERGEKFWRKISGEVAAGKSLLLAAWLEGEIVGTVQLDLAMAENQPHRAELEKLLVAPAHRRRGIGRALLARAEQVAAAHNRRLLNMDARAGDPAERLCRAMGWQEGGRIPGYALDADRSPAEMVFLYRQVG